MSNNNDEKLGFLEKPWREYESVEYWFKTLRTQATKDKSKAWFPHFLKHVQLSPDEIIAQRREDLKSDDAKTRARWEDEVKAWYHDEYERYEKEGKSSYTPFTVLTVVRSFFAHNRYPLLYSKGEIRAPKGKTKDYIPTNEDIRAMNNLSERWKDKSLLLALVQSGLSESDVVAINIEDFNGKWKEPWIYYEGHREKTEVVFQTCFGEDWINASEKMLALRGYPHEGPLYVQETGPEAGKRMKVKGVRKVIKKLFENAEIETGNEKFYVKNLRDVFSDALDRAEIKEKVATRMMGWKLGGAKSHYKISRFTIVEAYKKAWKYLTINAFQISPKRDVEVAKFFAKILQLNAIEDPIERQRETLNFIDEVKSVSMDFEGTLSFEALVKRALVEESA